MRDEPRSIGVFLAYQSVFFAKFQTLFNVRRIIAVRTAILFSAATPGPALFKNLTGSNFDVFYKKPCTFGKLKTLILMIGIFAIRAARYLSAAAARPGFANYLFCLFNVFFGDKIMFLGKRNTGFLIIRVVAVGLAFVFIGAVAKFGNRKNNVRRLLGRA